MKVLMVGAGAVGGYFGARLVKAGVDCAFLLRPRTLAAVKQKGLTVHSVDQSFTVHPVASSNPRDVPKARLFGGVAYMYAKIAEPGVIEHYKRGSVAIGTWRQTAVPEPPQKEEP